VIVLAVRKSSLEVADGIKQMIINEQLAPGTQLPSIESLAVAFQASKGTVREALRRLESIGVVEMEHGRGTFVRRPAVKELLESALWGLDGSISTHDVLEVLVSAERLAAALCVERATSADLELIKALIERMKTAFRAGDQDGLMSLEQRFYETIASTSRNELLAQLVAFLMKLLQGMRRVQPFSHPDLSTYEQVLWAVQARDRKKARELIAQSLNARYDSRFEQDLVIYCDGLGTGSLGGSFYTLGQVLSTLITRFTRINPVVRVTGGGVDNVRLTQERRLVVAISQLDVAVEAFYGREEFEIPSPDIRVLCCLPNIVLQISTLRDSGIKSLRDLQGRTAAIGAQGGASGRVALEVLRSYNLQPGRDFEPVVGPFSTAVEMLNKGEVDVVFFLSIGQSSALVELGCHRPLRLLSLDEDRLDALIIQHRYWSAVHIEANTYPGQTERVRSLGIPTVLICHKDLPNQDAYAIASAVCDNIKEANSLMFQAGTFKQCQGLGDLGIPIHPGAEQYFREAGLLLRA